jgi:hypothetical protein
MTDLQDNIPQQNSNQPKPRTSKSRVRIITLSSVVLIICVLGLFLIQVKNIFQDEFCRRYVEGLWVALTVYANDHENQLPPTDRWCDVLISDADMSTVSFICPGSDAIEGESTYAININAIGKKLDQLPPDMVLLFETDFGIGNTPRSESIRNRKFYSFFEKEDFQRSKEWLEINKEKKVFPGRWNVVGGSEILTIRYHGNRGCNVALVNGCAKWIPSNKIHTLRWTVDKP